MIATSFEMTVLTVLTALVRHPEILLVLLFGSMLLAVEVGRLYGWRRGNRLKPDTPGANDLNGVIFALMGLFMAFSFSGAAARFDMRRQLVINEVNSASTVSARIALAPGAAQPQLQAMLKAYVQARMEADRPSTDVRAVVAAEHRANAIGAKLWADAVAVGKRPDAAETVNSLLLPAINTMREAANALAFFALMHPPQIIHAMLVVLAWTAGFLAGIGLATHPERSYVHAITFAGIVSAVIFITIDLEYPRAGFIRTHSFEATITALSTLG